MSPDDDLLAAALRVLRANRQAPGYTRPAAGLYPHQWSWDSAFVAIGLARVDQAAAQRELETLFEGQWRTGMVPHVVYRSATDAYFPDPAFWDADVAEGAPANPRTSGLVQPPLHATAALAVHRHATDLASADAFLRRLFPRLVAWHAYLERERDPDGTGLVELWHPWESGQDNSPLWDPVWARHPVDLSAVPHYERKDTAWVAKRERPDGRAYDRFVFLVDLYRRLRYDGAAIRRQSPFRVRDVLFNALLCRADRDLAQVARLLDEDPTPFDERADRTRDAMNRDLWDERHGIYLDVDVATGDRLDVHVASGFTPLFAGVPDGHRAHRLVAYLGSRSFCGLGDACYAVPSYDRDAPGYSGVRYWRGPVWMNLNWVLLRGLLAYGATAEAAGVRRALVELPRRAGFREYYDPADGSGHGARDFSWTAALVLDALADGRPGVTAPPSGAATSPATRSREGP